MKINNTMYSKIITLFVLLFAISACDSTSNKKKAATNDDKTSVQNIVLNDSVKKVLILKGSSISKQVVSVLQKNLKSAIKKEGIDHAIDFCHNRAMLLTDSMSVALGVKVKRVAKKYRNSFNETSPVESDLYKSYIIDWLEKKPLTPKIIPDENGHPVYYSVIKINNRVCLKCHGTPGNEMPVERETKIKEYYPTDKAINFKYAEPRGMWVITFPEYKVVQK